jgi:hypothetical protein
MASGPPARVLQRNEEGSERAEEWRGGRAQRGALKWSARAAGRHMANGVGMRPPRGERALPRSASEARAGEEEGGTWLGLGRGRGESGARGAWAGRGADRAGFGCWVGREVAAR